MQEPQNVSSYIFLPEKLTQLFLVKEVIKSHSLSQKDDKTCFHHYNILV